MLEMLSKRGGWLSILLVGEMLTATAMGYFEDEIARAVVLALFIPLIIASGGNSGSQATSLIIRALALRRSSWATGGGWRVRELRSGALLGALLGVHRLPAHRALAGARRLLATATHYLLVALTVAVQPHRRGAVRLAGRLDAAVRAAPARPRPRDAPRRRSSRRSST